MGQIIQQDNRNNNLIAGIVVSFGTWCTGGYVAACIYPDVLNIWRAPVGADPATTLPARAFNKAGACDQAIQKVIEEINKKTGVVLTCKEATGRDRYIGRDYKLG